LSEYAYRPRRHHAGGGTRAIMSATAQAPPAMARFTALPNQAVWSVGAQLVNGSASGESISPLAAPSFGSPPPEFGMDSIRRPPERSFPGL
jgi:hypothetical protein